MTLLAGVLVCFRASPATTYQVVNVDDYCDCVGVRRFPLAERRRSTFGVPTNQVCPMTSELSR